MNIKMPKHSTLLSAMISISLLSSPAMSACKAPPLKQGMDYIQARKLIIKHSFMAPMLHAYGYQKDDLKVVSACGSVDICNKYPEIDSCGSGNCRMEFADAYNNQLIVITYGELDKGAHVTSFEITCSR